VGPTVEEVLANPSDPWAKASIELCGGTHISNTAEALDFVLVGEEAVAKGVRRVVGLTGEAAVGALSTARDLEDRLASWAGASAADGAAALEASKGELTALRASVDAATTSAFMKAKLRDELSARDKQIAGALKQLAQQRLDLASQAAMQDASAAAERGDASCVLEISGLDGKELQKLVTKVQKGSPSLAVAAFSVAGEKVFAYASVPKELQPALPASEWLKGALEAVGGRGGGKAASAQGSGANLDGMAAAKQAAVDFAAEAAAAASA
jgi:alanyl-tRNA synthetase